MRQERVKILLIEHDTGFTRTVGDMLGRTRDLGAEMSTAPGLKAGLSVLARDDFDLVMLDVSVPDGAGLANVSLIKAEAPELPVIVAGDLDDETVAVEAVQAGAQDYLVKSLLTPGWLERSIRYAIERHRLDMEVVAAAEKYHRIFDHLVEGIFQTSPEGKYLLANAALARIYGYESPEDLKENLTNIGEKLYVQKGRRDEFIREMQAHDTLSGFESQIYKKDGAVIWISENCRAARDATGRLLYYDGTVEDITQRKQAEENLRNSESLYHSLVETLPQNIFRKDLQGRFTFANQQFCKTLGRELKDIIGKTDFDFFPRELAEKYQHDDHRVIESGQNYATVEENQPPGGQKMYVQVVKTPLYGADGQPIGLQGIFWDITAQRLADEKVRRVNTLLAANRKELRAKNQQMQDDLKMAREIQTTMLPQQYPTFPHIASQAESAFHFTHRYLPAGTVGGDFFTVSALSDTEAGVFICDVAGHGVRSALVTAMIRALVEELKPLATDPGKFLTKLNCDLHAILRHTGSPMLTTAFYLVADSKSGIMRFANAGHPKPLHVRRSEGKVESLSAKGKAQPALGLFDGAEYTASELKLAPHDLVMMFTDGLCDVEPPSGGYFTQENLIDALKRRLQLPAAPLFDQLLAEIQQFSERTGFCDDVCILGIEASSLVGG